MDVNVSVSVTSFNSLVGVPGVQFTVPFFQRSYAWETEQVEELWNDLMSALGGSHFMGSLVLNINDPNRPEIIDGQQRITTLFLILAAIRDTYGTVKAELVEKIQALYIENQWQKDKQFKLQAGEANHEVLRDFVLRRPGDQLRKQWSVFDKLPSAQRRKNRQLFLNARRIQELLDRELGRRSGVDDQVSFLERLEQTVVTSLEFVVIKVPNAEDAFLIFETLNDRGLELSAGDLLKNHILAEAAKRKLTAEVLASEWDDMVTALCGADITRFLRHYLLAKYTKITKKDVFPLFRDEVKRVGPDGLMAKLGASAKIYGDLIEPKTSDFDDDTVRSLENLKLLKASVCYSFLMPARQFLDDAKFTVFVRAAEVMTFRYSSVCGKGSNDLELAYHGVAEQLTTTCGAAAADALGKLKQFCPKSDEFRAAFQRQSMGQKDTARYMLSELERSLDSEEKFPATAGSKLHIEHILPQTPIGEWLVGIPGESSAEKIEFLREYISLWGNLTLLGGKKNSKASNGPFCDKKEVYEKSNILMTQQLASVKHWGLEDIAKRQAKLAEDADELWSIDTLQLPK